MRWAFTISIFVLGLAAACYAQSSDVWVPSKILDIVYPTLARHGKIYGDVKAKCLIKADGSVATVEILSSAHDLLSIYVKKNLLQWKFRKTVSEIQANEVIVTYTFQFSGECKDERLCKDTEFWYEYPYHVMAIADQYSGGY